MNGDSEVTYKLTSLELAKIYLEKMDDLEVGTISRIPCRARKEDINNNFKDSIETNIFSSSNNGGIYILIKKLD